MQKHYGPLHAHIAKIVNYYHDADEITNASFLKAYNERELSRILINWSVGYILQQKMLRLTVLETEKPIISQD